MDLIDEELFQNSNKHETPKKTIAEESKQWESLFDPQYTFGSFQHGIAKPVIDVYYNGKWPLDQQDNMLSEQTSPALPNIENIQLHINTTDSNDAEIEILPRPFPKYQNKNTDVVCKDRLELLNIIQEVGFNKENDATQSNPYKQFSTAARFQQQIKNKTKQMKQEIMMDDDHVSRHENSSLASIEDLYEKVSFHEPKEDNEPKRKNRASFLYFSLGFLFPPLWLIGALYVPKSQRTSASKSIDKKWKTYSRNALFAFLIAMVLTVVLVLIMKPETVGFRNSNEDGYKDARVVFDEDVIFDPSISLQS